jgi:hypothetical protein
MPPRQSPPLKVFLSYSHKDREACEELQKHLTPLEDSGLIKVWVDSRTRAGEEWEGPIDDNLNAAEIILLLLSPNFANSHYCKNIEMKRACERADNREALLIPILYDHFKWEAYPQIEKRKLLPLDAKPVVDWGENRNKVWKTIVDQIVNDIEESLSMESQKSIVPPLVCYLVNRNDQNEKIDSSLSKLEDSSKSMLIIAQGNTKDCLGDYVQILCHYRIPNQIKLKKSRKTDLNPPVDLLKMVPLSDKELTADHSWWKLFVEEMVGYGSLQEQAVKKFSDQLKSNNWLIWFEIKTSFLGKEPAKSLQTCIDFAVELKKNIKPSKSHYKLIYVITINFDEDNLAKQFLGFAYRKKQIKNFLSSFNSVQADEHLEYIVLPEMETIKKIAVNRWAEERVIKPLLNHNWTDSTINKLYPSSTWKTLVSDGGIPMEDLAYQLAQHLKSKATS